jgi:hypothetical protein
VVIFITKPADTKDCAMEDATSDATMVSYAKHLYVAAAVVNRHVPATDRWFECPFVFDAVYQKLHLAKDQKNSLFHYAALDTLVTVVEFPLVTTDGHSGRPSYTWT